MLGAWKLIQAGYSLSADGMQPELQFSIIVRMFVVGNGSMNLSGAATITSPPSPDFAVRTKSTKS
jgi:hypothetical protein